MARLDDPIRRNPRAPGWYVDPDDTTHERWYTGTQWSDQRGPLASSLIGETFERGMRPALNPFARWGRLVAFAALLALLAALIDGSVLARAGLTLASGLGLGLGIVLGAGGLVLGLLGRRAAPRLGGPTAAAASAILGAAVVLIALFALAYATTGG